jgi:hypothetical protein
VTDITEFYETVAHLTFGLMDFIIFELTISAIIRVDRHNNIKIVFDPTSKFKKTSLYVYIILLIAVIHPYVSDYMQDILISFFATAGWKTIPAFCAVSSFISFWTSKFVLGRSWELPIVKTSFFVLVLSSCLLML